MGLESALLIMTDVILIVAVVVVIWLLLKRDRLLKREQERADYIEKRNFDLIDFYRSAVIPALEKSATATLNVITYLTAIQEQRKLENLLVRRDIDTTPEGGKSGE